MDRTNLNRIIIVLIVVLITAVFFAMIRQFVMAIVLAGIFSAMAQPVYRRIEQWLGGRSNLASLATIVFIFLIFLVPLVGILGIVAGQAIKISQSVRPFIDQWMNTPSAFSDRLQSLPFYGNLTAYQGLFLQKTGEMVSRVSTFLFNSASSITVSTINTVFLFFVFLYTMFFFLKEGRAILDRFLYYIPLPRNVEQRILERFISVAKAAIKGTLVIGIIQGSLAGAAFWVVGIEGAAFWGTVMTVLSIIPAVGSAIIWFPAAVILAFTGSYLKAVGLFAFCSLLVGSVDNLVRPWLVGRGTQLHELMIFFGTLGGLSLFGLVGFIIGPIVAALFTTVWDIYAENFSDLLPDMQPEDRDERRS
ncbi:MAG TPA: AI-2E family transporter [Deltaproteobacteria bacterium]|nr:AI-2E family transporter [Deltaproteobacteria bacterium]HPR54905.1 AI-2E family transporter [Deltaproteobacteria bacterium]HXK48228.1 AI-2E family transporter [Deltaproteobacteria bacterium]